MSDLRTPKKELRFMELAVAEARKCVPEDPNVHPYVGAVAVKQGKVLAAAFRGEQNPGEHAEFTLLEKKLSRESLAGCTVYTTLEPCTTRRHPKMPCVQRLIQRTVKRVVIGQLDPNPTIRGEGYFALREANITVELFPAHLMACLEELNRNFIRAHRQARVGLGSLLTEKEIRFAAKASRRETISAVDMAHEVLLWLQMRLSKVDGSYLITQSTFENRRITAQLYTKVEGEIIATCFFESPDYGSSDYAATVTPFTTFTRVTASTVCPPTAAKLVARRLAEFQCRGRLVVISKGTTISQIGGIFCRMKDKSHLAFVALNNRGGTGANQGLVLCGSLAKELFDYYQSFTTMKQVEGRLTAKLGRRPKKETL